MANAARNSGIEPLQVGVVGGGYIGKKVGRQFEYEPRSVVTALADVDTETLATAGEALRVGEDSRYTDYREMLDVETLDAVVIGTPHAFHYEQVTAALDRNLHVLCDKPLTTDVVEARDLASRAASSDSVLMVGYQRHLNPAFQRARERWQGDRSPDYLSAEIIQNWYPRFQGTWRTDPDLSGGGNLYDTGSHLVDAVLWTTGLVPETVSAEMVFADQHNQVDVRALLTIRFRNGAHGTISVHSQAPCVREHLHVWDDAGAVYLEGRQWEDRKLSEVEPDSTTRIPFVDDDQQRSKAEAFVDSVEQGTEPPATARDALAVTALTEAAYESARTGDRVRVALD